MLLEPGKGSISGTWVCDVLGLYPLRHLLSLFIFLPSYMCEDLTEVGQGWENLRMLRTDEVLMYVIHSYFQI